jgi:hypothetical protein
VQRVELSNPAFDDDFRHRGSPFGSPEWQEKTARSLGLEFTLRDRSRPRKPSDESGQ